MPNDWGFPSLLLVYFGIIGTLIIGAGFGLTKFEKAAAEMSERSQREKTLLHQRMNSAREIKQALGKPVALSGNAVVASAVPDKKPPKLSQAAHNTFASTDFSAHSRSSVHYDRHAPQ